MSKDVILKGNYCGLTITLSTSRIPSIYENSSIGKTRYVVTVQYISADPDNRLGSLDSERDSVFHDGRPWKFRMVKKLWYYNNIIEATAWFDKIRKHIRSIGEFRNINKSKIPDKRDRE